MLAIFLHPAYHVGSGHDQQLNLWRRHSLAAGVCAYCAGDPAGARPVRRLVAVSWRLLNGSRLMIEPGVDYVFAAFLHDDRLAPAGNPSRKIRLTDLLIHLQAFERDHPVCAGAHTAEGKLAFGVSAGAPQKLRWAWIGAIRDKKHGAACGLLFLVE